MRVLVIGAGAVGGYFGGRLLEAGRDVTFLVRPRRRTELAGHGLKITSPVGDLTIAKPPTVTAEDLRHPFDLILLSCKAFDLEAAIPSFARAVGPDTAILPLLNGMLHLDMLDARFGPARVIGGQCGIATTLGENGTVVHLNNLHVLGFGERDGASSERVRAIAALMEGARFQAHASDAIVQEMWEKWVLLASMAASTCHMRATIGDICGAPGGTDLVLRLIEECRSVATLEGYAPRPAFLERTRAMLTATDSPLTASMFRDVERNAPIEADHVIGDLIRLGSRQGTSGLELPALRTAYTHLKAYEARRRRTQAAALPAVAASAA